jgi:hypothetical protein
MISTVKGKPPCSWLATEASRQMGCAICERTAGGRSKRKRPLGIRANHRSLCAYTDVPEKCSQVVVAYDPPEDRQRGCLAEAGSTDLCEVLLNGDILTAIYLPKAKKTYALKSNLVHLRLTDSARRVASGN